MKFSNYRYCGFRRVAASSPEVSVADVNFNVDRILETVDSSLSDFCSLLVFPELCVTGYTCADLFLQPFLIENAEKGIRRICRHTDPAVHPGHESKRRLHNLLLVVGAPVKVGANLYNCALFIRGGRILAVVPKTFIPNYGEFYERRWFESAAGLGNSLISYAGENAIPFGTRILVTHDGMTIGAEICEDLWTPIPPSAMLAIAGADVIVNLSASNAVLGKQRYRRDLILQQSARCRCAYIYASAGAGESSTDLAFPGYAAVAENGAMLSESQVFPDVDNLADLSVGKENQSLPMSTFASADIDVSRLQSERIRFNTFTDIVGRDTLPDILIVGKTTGYHEFDPTESEESENYELTPVTGMIHPTPFVPTDASHRNENCTEIINIQCHGLLQRLNAIGKPKMIIGVSGGLDSTLALLVAVRTAKMAGMKPSDVIGITMPGLATTNRTHNNAWQLMTRLGCTAVEIPIGEAVKQHFSDIGQNPEKFDATYENSQARERTQILMDYANKTGGIVVGTGDLSELALGWCTYNGDHMSMYAVNTSVPKTLVKYLVEWFALKEKDEKIRNILLDIIDTPISPELIPAKEGKDEIQQKTEDLVGPYELHDFFLFHTLRNSFYPVKIYHLAEEAFRGRFDSATILHWLKTFYRRFFNQQFKRSCLPDGPKVGSVCLSPRGDWRMPSDASSRMWLASLDEIKV